jgi:hypothetical protein
LVDIFAESGSAFWVNHLETRLAADKGRQASEHSNFDYRVKGLVVKLEQ